MTKPSWMDALATCSKIASPWMSCLSPTRNGRGSTTKVFACGHCGPCVERRRKGWIARIIREQLSHASNSFVTLTLDEQNVHLGLSSSPMRMFIQRLRRNISPSIRYFACGEHGSKTERPHWHVALFGYQPPLGMHRIPQWPHGFTYTGTLNTKSAGYVAKYVLKSSLVAMRDPTKSNKILSSKRPPIGCADTLSLAEKFYEAWKMDGVWPTAWTVGGRKYPVARTLSAKLRADLEAQGITDLPPAAEYLRPLAHAHEYLIDTGMHEYLEKPSGQHERKQFMVEDMTARMLRKEYGS